MNGIFNYQIPGRATSYNIDQYQKPSNHHVSPNFNGGWGNLNPNFQNLFSQLSNLLSSLIGNIQGSLNSGISVDAGYTPPISKPDPGISTKALGEEDGGNYQVGKPDNGKQPIVTLAFPEDGGGITEEKGKEVLVNRPVDNNNKQPIATLAFPEDGGGDGWQQVGKPDNNKQPIATLAFPEDGGGDGWQQVGKPDNGKQPIATLAFPEDGGGNGWQQVGNPLEDTPEGLGIGSPVGPQVKLDEMPPTAPKVSMQRWDDWFNSDKRPVDTPPPPGLLDPADGFSRDPRVTPVDIYGGGNGWQQVGKPDNGKQPIATLAFPEDGAGY